MKTNPTRHLFFTMRSYSLGEKPVRMLKRLRIRGAPNDPRVASSAARGPRPLSWAKQVRGKFRYGGSGTGALFHFNGDTEDMPNEPSYLERFLDRFRKTIASKENLERIAAEADAISYD